MYLENSPRRSPERKQLHSYRVARFVAMKRELNQQEPETVAFRVVPDFREPTLLFAGTGASLKRFASLLRQAPPVRTDLHNRAEFLPLGGTRVMLVIGQESPGIRKDKAAAGDAFIWQLTPDIAKNFAIMIDNVANHKKPAHHYLECDGFDDVTVVVSKDEYDDLSKFNKSDH